MNISCTGISKIYRKETLFSELNYHFTFPGSYAILGPNASGKSTLLKILAGLVEPNTGEVKYASNSEEIPVESCYKFISFSSPELQLFDHQTVEDIIQFHFKLKPPKISVEDIIESAGLKRYLGKKFSELSSGLKNKLKLSLALFTDTPLLLLDEPCTNFDDANAEWYRNTVKEHCSQQLLIIASNQAIEHDFCENLINIEHYKFT